MSNGGPADGAAEAAVDRRLRPPRFRVDERARTWWTVRSALGVALALAPQLAALAALLATGLSAGPLPVTAVVTLVLGLAHVVVVPRMRYRLHRWEVTDDAVHTLSGWLRLEWRIAPISRIQTVDTDRGPLQRILGLSSVTVTTASSSGALHVDGLDTGAADRLARDLTAAADAAPGDAT